MLRREREWLELQQRLGDSRAVVRLDSASVEALKDQRSYRVLIQGFNLYPHIAPPLVTVGGLPLEQIQYQPDGRCITGVLNQKPGRGPIKIDYGYAEAELRDEIQWDY